MLEGGGIRVICFDPVFNVFCQVRVSAQRVGLYLERLYISPQLVEFLLIPHSGSGTYLEERVLQPSIEKTAVHLVLRKQLWVLKKKRLELEQFRLQIVDFRNPESVPTQILLAISRIEAV